MCCCGYDRTPGTRVPAALLQELQLFLLSGHSLRVDVGFTALIKYQITDWRLLMVVAGCVPEVTREGTGRDHSSQGVWWFA